MGSVLDLQAARMARHTLSAPSPEECLRLLSHQFAADGHKLTIGHDRHGWPVLEVTTARGDTLDLSGVAQGIALIYARDHAAP